ncbi:MAG: phBC6A51 family helix-turn-helix protein [Candidatus Peribacteraceae bacterium]|nr:phBC6A51 family helix-turn-helix protein [Candidatus Peribacteraceae bacterium]MDD5742318.1 phBC6A51 family helix-turn-helix protein [Candidatus Peribacteraceae bacterium]
MTKHQEVIDARKTREQAALLEQLRKMPIIQVACEKAGVSRATYYRWRKEDDAFTTSADEALQDGVSLVSDMAESQLLTGIRNGNLGAVMYWLKHRNTNYNTKLEVTAKIKTQDEALTPEQRALIEKAIELSALGGEMPSPISPSQPTDETESTPL